MNSFLEKHAFFFTFLFDVSSRPPNHSRAHGSREPWCRMLIWDPRVMLFHVLDQGRVLDRHRSSTARTRPSCANRNRDAAANERRRDERLAILSIITRPTRSRSTDCWPAGEPSERRTALLLARRFRFRNAANDRANGKYQFSRGKRHSTGCA